MNRPARATAYRGPYPIHTHRTLADVGPAVIVEGEFREVHGQRFRITPEPLREDPRVLQAHWDQEPHGVNRCVPPDHAAQFREINEALRGPEPAGSPTVIVLVYLIGSAIGGAALVAGVITGFAVLARLLGGQ